jgi:hypothetical protein
MCNTKIIMPISLRLFACGTGDRGLCVPMPAVETIMNVINAFASSIICAISAGPKFHFFLEAFNLKTAFGGG